MKLRVTIQYKEEVLDAQGRAVQQRLIEMGYSEVRGVRVGKAIDIDLDLGEEKTATDKITKMCNELLVNATTEEFKIQTIE